MRAKLDKKVKIVLYYIGMFFAMCLLIFFIEIKSDIDINKSYEKSSVKGFQQYVSVPKNLEVLGRYEDANFFKVVYSTITDELLMFLFFVISTIPLTIYSSAKYIEKLDDETNDLIDMENSDIQKNKDNAKQRISPMHRMHFDNGKLNYNSGVYAGMLTDTLKVKNVFATLSNLVNNAIIFEQDYTDIEYIKKMLKGASYDGESIILVDRKGLAFEATKDMMLDYDYDVKRIDLSNQKKNIFKREKGIRINILEYFTSDEEIKNLSRIISGGNSHVTKMITSLIHVTVNDSRIDVPTISDVYNLSILGLENLKEKANYVKKAYEAYNELILLDDNVKEIILKEASECLGKLNILAFNSNKKRREETNLFDMTKNPTIMYVVLDDMKVSQALVNVIFESIYNVQKINYLAKRQNVKFNDNSQKTVFEKFAKKNDKNKEKKVYLINPSFDVFMKYQDIASRLRNSTRYNITYILGIEKVKNFKEKYDYEFEKMMDSFSIRIFYAVRQYETTSTLKEILDNVSLKEITNLIDSADTNKCIVCLDNNYLLLNKAEPTGEVYDKYNYKEIENMEKINKIKNKDVKVKVDYLEECHDRIKDNMANKEKKARQKALNLKPELTKEEKEYIASLLSDKNHDSAVKDIDKKAVNKDSKKEVKREKHILEVITSADYRKNKEKENIERENKESAKEYFDENIFKNAPKIVTDKNNTKTNSNNIKDDRNNDKSAIIKNSDKNISDNTNNDTKANKDSKRNNDSVTEKDINESIDKLNEMQNKFKRLMDEEKKKATHALFEQMKKL